MLDIATRWAERTARRAGVPARRPEVRRRRALPAQEPVTESSTGRRFRRPHQLVQVQTDRMPADPPAAAGWSSRRVVTNAHVVAGRLVPSAGGHTAWQDATVVG